MTNERWAAVWELFSSIRDMPAEQRSLLLRAESLDPEVRAEVLELLEVSGSRPFQQALYAPRPTDASYPAGHEFGRYVIVGPIAQGGFGRIYAARDKELRRAVAIKVLSGPLDNRGERVIEEARAASALNHPNIVTIYETISADDHVAMVMEFVDGQSLRQTLREAAGALPMDWVVKYGCQVGEALEAAHGAGIVHRDVKPENVLLRKDGYAKLVDFGLATQATAQPLRASPESLVGTLRYISPEQLRGEPASAASDVFSLGLVLYEMSAGVHPFSGGTPLDAADAILTKQPTRLSTSRPGIPDTLDRLILAMLSKTPSARPSAGEVVRALRQISSEPRRPFGTRSRLAAGAAVVAAALLLIVWPPWNRRPAPLVLRMDTRPLTGEAGRELNPALSPDGNFVVYTSDGSADGKNVTQVREIDSDRKIVLSIPGPFSWHPDSSRIGFIRRGAEGDSLCSISKDGTSEEAILTAKDIDRFEWSADGGSILYTSRPAHGGGAHAVFLRN